ncbi:MAG: D-alanyl-D-alanine carboxypeptidase/D-alanyl-D-alanine-endopeptidase [Acidobacteriota bacterium]|nr:D-alanyl-D-alanine carboxypeptidase/D-alanyl-D-alanine-endopeptidase [Acidobacteriota bacterium]
MASNARRRSGTLRFPWVGWLVWALTVALLAGLVWYAGGPLARDRGWLVDGGSPTVDPRVIARLHPDPVLLGAGVIDPVGVPDAAPADPGRVQQAMAATPPELPGRYASAVADLGGGPLHYDLNSTAPMIPASTLKVMLAVAVLDALGPQQTLATTVVSPAPGMIVLVGGGDPLLASTPTSYPFSSMVSPPTTEALAASTAVALTAQGISEVSLGYDDALFTGAVWHPDWPAVDRQFIAPISALVVDEGAAASGVESASPSAARTFADQLRANGITVTGDPTPVTGVDAAELARVESLPLSLLVQELLAHSDNFIAEMLLRQLALASGQPGSFEGGAAALTASLQDLGLWVEGHAIADGSGLSTGNRLTTGALIKALQLAAAREDLAAVLSGMPVGTATGTLTNRFVDTQSAPARGQVRAKTGSLDQVSGLVGYTPTADGALLAFAVLGNELPSDQDPRAWFDHVGAALAGCACVA